MRSLTGAFAGCSSLTNIYYKGTVESWCNILGLGDIMSYGSNSKNLYLNDKLVTDLVIPNTITQLHGYAFYGCSSLTSVVIGNSVTRIGGYAFYNCSSLTSVVIGDSVTRIGHKAFNGCSSLTSITIPNKVSSIEPSAFHNCSSLTSIIFEDTSTWYRTTSITAWDSKTGGTSTNVDTPSTNATYFASTYYDYYWYKK